jgi:hypothetical protein
MRCSKPIRAKLGKTCKIIFSTILVEKIKKRLSYIKKWSTIILRRFDNFLTVMLNFILKI